MTGPTLTWVDTPDGLDASARTLQARVRAGARLAVDTEFHAERRYHPELMVVQLAVEGGDCWLFDARKLDLAPLASVLDGRVWLAHGAALDVSILHATLGVRPSGLLDTQLLAAFCGLGFPRRLTDLVVAVLEEDPAPSATLTDWSRRPLSPQQQRYAASDVRTVLRLAACLGDRLSDDHRAWAAAAGQERIEEALAAPDPDRRWRALSIASDFDGTTRAVLHQLHGWREGVARSAGQPPGYVLSDGALLDLARRRPRRVGALGENRRIARGFVKRHGEAVVREIAAALASDDVPSVPSREARQQAALLRLAAQADEAATGVAAELLLPPARALDVAVCGAGALSGWRVEAAGDLLRGVLAGRLGVFLGASGVCVR